MSGGLGMFKNALFEDLMVQKRFKNTGERLTVLQSTVVNAAKVFYRLVDLSTGLLTSVVGLDVPGVGTVLPEDLVVLEAGSDGPVSDEVWSCKDLFPMGILLCLCEGIFLKVLGIFWTWRLVGWTACAVGMSMPVPAVSDSLCRYEESAMTLQGSHQYCLCHQMRCCHWCHLYCTHYHWGRVWTGCCR